MVDLDKIRGGGDSSGSDSDNSTESKSKDTGSQTTQNSGSDPTEPYSIDEVSKPGDMGMADTSKRWADEHGDVNVSANSGEALKQYVARQVKETEELYDNVRDIANSHMEGQEEFALYFHTLMLNLSNNRLGIMKNIENEFNKSEKEALELTDKICEKAGETEMVKGVLNDMVKDLWEYEAPE